MNRFEFRLPDIGEGTAEAECVAWHVEPGSRVEEDDPLLEVMTDKATVEVTSPVSGTVLERRGAVGEMLSVGGVVLVLDMDGEGHGTAEQPPEAVPEPTPVPAPAPPPAATPARVLASPAVRRRAADHRIDLAGIAGSGPDGRVRQQDLDAVLAGQRRTAPPAPVATSAEGVESVPVTGLRRRIAERLQDTVRRVPHFTYVEEVDVTQLEALRAVLNAGAATDRPRLTVLPFLLRAMAQVLPDFPQINARYDDEAGILHRHRTVDAGIATQTPAGLVVTVLRDAGSRDLWGNAREIARLSDLARAGKAAPADLSGSTITITSLGAMGGIVSTPVINSPEVAIVGVNRIAERPVVRDGRVEVAKMMNLSSSFDHRIVDGWDAAAFIQAVKRRLETPALLFIEG